MSPRVEGSIWNVATAGARSHAFFPVRPRDPVVRPLPFPFRGALAISNDAEFLSIEFFEALMAFLNTRRETPFGRGLGLRVTSSAFFFSAHPYNFSYFAGSAANAPRSATAARIDDYLRSGWVDTIHAYGDFDGVGGCTRAHAEATFRALHALGVRLECFSNHGSAENVQNVGADAAYHCGDRKTHPAYHADLLEKHGVRYVWTDSLVTPFALPGGRRARLLRWLRPPPPPQLLERCRLQDGREFWGFRRLRGTGANAPNLSSLGIQLDQIDWGAMYASGSATVVYQHLGVLRRTEGVCTAATIAEVRADPGRYLAPFARLQREQEAGDLWVCGCAELLRYAEMVREVTVRRNGSAGSCELDFPRPVAAPQEFFAGLTVATESAERVKVTHAGQELAVTWNPSRPGENRHSLTVTRRERPDIW